MPTALPRDANPIYLARLQFLRGPVEKDYSKMKSCHSRPPGLCSLKSLKNRRFPANVHRKIKEGLVLQCNLHEVMVRTHVNKGVILDSPRHTLKVEVRYVHLEGTLIPFGNVGQHCDGKLVGTLPLSKEMQDKFHPINHEDRLHGYKCYLTKYHVRYFVQEDQKFYRLGDLLSLRTIIDAMEWSGETCNFVYFWSILCNHACCLAQARKKRKTDLEMSERIKLWKQGTVGKNKVTKTMLLTYNRENLLKEGAIQCTKFLSDLFDGVQKVGMPKKPIRSVWMRWNLANKDMDQFRSPWELDYCSKERKKSEVRGGVQDTSTCAFWRRQMGIHLGLQLITSEQVRDEVLKQMYMEVTHGMMSVEDMIAPLKVVSFFSYYRHLGSVIRQYSIQNKKALYLLQYLIIVRVKYGGRLPERADHLMAIPDFAQKKTAVVLNELGLYEGTKLGPGADAHMIRCFKLFIPGYAERSDDLNKSYVTGMCKHIPVNPGVEAK